MPQRNWLAIGASLILCAAFFFPTVVEAAGKSKISHSSSAKKSTTSAKKPHKVSRSATASTKTKAGKSAVKNDNGKVAATDRNIWMKRAKNSEALTGKASWYGKDFHNKATASGLAYDMHTFTAAHRTLPIGTIVKVTDQNNGKSVMVCVTDRGPFVPGRIIDVSYAAAAQLGLNKRGVGKVQLEVVSDETGTPLKKDQAYFVKYASAGGKSKVGPFHAFADAAAMHEALRQAHPEAEVVLEKTQK